MRTRRGDAARHCDAQSPDHSRDGALERQPRFRPGFADDGDEPQRQSRIELPAKSERNTVTFEADYVAATDIQPGYSWVKNDYEKVRENY